MYPPLARLGAAGTEETPLPHGAQDRVHEHPGETYQRSDRQETPAAAPERARRGNQEGSCRPPERSEPGDAAAGAGLDAAPAEEETGSRGAPCTERGGPGIGGGRGERARHGPEAEQGMLDAEERRERRRCAVGDDLPVVPAVSLGVGTGRRAGHAGDDAAGDEEDAEHRAAGPTGATEDERAHERGRKRSACGQGARAPGGGRDGRGYQEIWKEWGGCQPRWASARSSSTMRRRSLSGQVSLPTRLSSMRKKFSSNR